MSENTTDEQIAAQVAKIPEMYGFLIDRYESKLDRYILRQSGLGSDQRKDILQEVFIKAYENIASFDPRMSFNAWIYRICHNAIISDWKRNKRYRSGVSFDNDESRFLENLFADDDSLKDVYARENANIISQALSKIKPAYKDILVLRFFEELQYDEISDILKIPLGTVATNISRAKKELARHIINSA